MTRRKLSHSQTGKKLNVRRFDDRWISAVSGDVSYELIAKAAI